jgi:hypothetical protein
MLTEKTFKVRFKVLPFEEELQVNVDTQFSTLVSASVMVDEVLEYARRKIEKHMVITMVIQEPDDAN